jgi:hypothetical protein
MTLWPVKKKTLKISRNAGEYLPLPRLQLLNARNTAA